MYKLYLFIPLYYIISIVNNIEDLLWIHKNFMNNECRVSYGFKFLIRCLDCLVHSLGELLKMLN